ncbi:UDP-N-acetylglucosamine 2-epimerase (non-hydrolyzing) [Tyzzerella sp. OttesenSCG-928-J15]|nr:UDP-N-acetylglucosamine 2-epimerase (non-hydrolyzing) [Tyzzerella sp. OttesenSCG-928-J15]
MDKIKVMSVFGTRPEATKMAPLVKQLEADDCFKSIVCVTAQHREMLDETLEIFDIKPDYDLNIMKEGQTLDYITATALTGLCGVIDEAQPDIVLVHGDTSTTFVAALAAFYKKVKVGHVEAGLRTGDKYQPYPEEMNRKLAGVIADLHFSPTKDAKLNLLKENIDESSIFITGNTAIDCVKSSVKSDYVFKRDMLNQIDFENKKVIAMTAHRRENIGKPLEEICRAVLDIVNNNKDVEVVYPVHPNPAVKNTVYNMLYGAKGVHITKPLDFVDMHNLLAKSYLILTDSGGIQEEAPTLNKPVLVLRNVTERPEGLSAGTLKIAGTQKDNIANLVGELIENADEYNRMANAPNPFGDGFASKRIAEFIKYYFKITDNKPDEFYVKL